MTQAKPPASGKGATDGSLRHLRMVPYLAVVNGLTVLILGGAMAPFVLPVVNVALIGAYVYDEVKAARSKKRH